MTPTEPSSTTAAADRYRRLSERFSAVVDAVPAAAWTSPSPCEGWTAADVLDHVVTTEADLLGRMPFAPDPAIDVSSPIAAWPVVRAAVQEALDDPDRGGHTYDGHFGPTTFAATIDTFYDFDLVAHTWDLAHAAGLAEFEPFDPAEIERIERDLAPLGDNVRMPGILGPVIEVAADATPDERFIGFLGRRP